MIGGQRRAAHISTPTDAFTSASTAEGEKRLKKLERALGKEGIEFRPESYKWSCVQVLRFLSDILDVVAAESQSKKGIEFRLESYQWSCVQVRGPFLLRDTNKRAFLIKVPAGVVQVELRAGDCICERQGAEHCGCWRAKQRGHRVAA